jgi:hypothetical protein
MRNTAGINPLLLDMRIRWQHLFTAGLYGRDFGKVGW